MSDSTDEAKADPPTIERALALCSVHKIDVQFCFREQPEVRLSWGWYEWSHALTTRGPWAEDCAKQILAMVECVDELSRAQSGRSCWLLRENPERKIEELLSKEEGS